ncbi:iron-containing redox enzyme family protein [Hydrogenophaga sp. RAC07]|uniref:iron-containing redox enzyme family protein n=1 Tax=Hydrogenophaga sp. RAC07 TaxID=1842537 RepID=UPI0008571173|nr:iron-containing redox enzyme family protein [Hydrogenophaga sp. RAC07]AOF86520.1 iron-containing redox enzyme family protein [Hydrogenophaga sp. RAC07]
MEMPTKVLTGQRDNTLKIQGDSMINPDDQKRLASIYTRHFNTADQLSATYETLTTDLNVAIAIEKEMLALEDLQIVMRKGVQSGAEHSGAEFVSLVKDDIKRHAANQHEFYEEFLPNRATVEDLAFYLAQETLQDPRFDDFIAALQMGLPARPKLELASNYWDEMGNGEIARMHTVMFQNVADSLGLTDEYIQDSLTTDGLWCGNLSTMLVLRRHLIYRGMGYFATIEHMFPKRCLSLIAAWQRLGLPTRLLEYHEEHVRVDARHASGFFQRVIAPLVDMTPGCAREMHWGVLARLNSSGRHLDALLERFKSGVNDAQSLGPHCRNASST